MNRISIIIPVYNAEKYLDRCLYSVLDQDFTSYEVILVDDGSTDSSLQICERHAACDPRVKVVLKTNGGVSSARNAGIEAATGDRLMFLDCDDVLEPDALELLSRHDADIVVGGFRKVVDGKTDYVRSPRRDRKYSGIGQLPGFFDDVIGRKDCRLLNSSCFKLFRRSLIADNGIRFDERLRYGEDKIFVLKYLCHIGSAATISSVVYDYVLQNESLSSDESSDGHLGQVFLLMQMYAPVLKILNKRFGASLRLAELYHTDMICRYAFRILTQFAVRKSDLLTEDNIALLYSYMDEDDRLNLMSVRFRQIPTFLLYRIGRPGLTRRFYSFTSSIFR